MAMNPDVSGSLEDQVGELRLRVLRLEKVLQSHGFAADPAQIPFPPSAAAPASAPAWPGPLTPPGAAVPPATNTPASRVSPSSESTRPSHAPPMFGTHAPAGKEPDQRSLENRIGSQYFNRLGILAMLIGVAWFLKLAFDNHWIGPLGRVFIGLLAGAALIAWSERFEKRGFTAFSYSLKAVGSGTLYLSLWAAFSVYALMPGWAAFGAMILVTAFNGYISWSRNTELLALYAIAGGLTTPLLVSTGGNHEVTLFSYLLILDVAVLILVALRPWSRLLFAAFIGTIVFFAGWWFDYYNHFQWGRTAFFLTCFFLIFAFAPRLARFKADEHATPSGWDSLVLVLLPIMNAALAFVAYYVLLSSSTADWAGPWIAVAFAAFYLGLLRLPARGVLRASPALLSALHLATAVVFLTLAIPLKTHGRWLTIGWLIEGAVLLWVAIRLHQLLLRVLALVCLVLGLGALLLVNPEAAATPFFNQRFATYCVAIVVFASVAWLAAHATEEPVEPILRWHFLAAAAVLTVNALILLAIGSEIHEFWWSLSLHADLTTAHDYAMYAQFTYSAFFMAFGALLLYLGFWRRSAFLRWQALVLIGATIAKVFLIDISELSRGFRIFSFLGLGALLLAVSFVYQRDWLNLRGEGNRTS